MGVKSFFISNYIQRTTKFGNICLLTATPFTNNPLEVYNMLALTNIKRLEEKGVKSISTFFDNYVNQSFERVIKISGKIVDEAVIKGWNNKISLQKILFSAMNYKSGEDANIQRPEKWTLPKLSEVIDGSVIPLSAENQVTTYLKPTPLQKQNQQEISRWLIAQMNDSEARKKAPHLVANNMAKKNCISPYIYEEENPHNIDPTAFVESSPKLKYTMDCVKSVRDWHIKDGSNVSGQVIYVNGGVDYLFLIKEYLIEKIGYKRNVHEYKKGKFYDEVQILAGKVDGKNVTEDEKESVKDLFNKGIVKVIIGTAMIREGIDLQVQSSCLYSLWVDWNPTDYKQLEGRIWRFGNEFANVRIVSPLLIGSSDSFTYQKLEEKTARINDIFDRNDKANMLEIGTEDVEAVKWALVDDLSEVAKAKIKDLKAVQDKELQVNRDNVRNLEGVRYDIDNTKSKLEDIEKFVKEFMQFANTDNLDEDYVLGNALEDVKIIIRQKESIVAHLDETLPSLTWSFERAVDTASWDAKQLRKDYKKLDKIEEQIKEKYNVSIYSDDLEGLIEKLKGEGELIKQEKQRLGSEETFLEVLNELEEERMKFNAGIDDYSATLSKFTDLNYLLGDKIREQQVPVKNKEVALGKEEKVEVVSELVEPTEEKPKKEAEVVEPTVPPFQLGDMWKEDFDYIGMMKYAKDNNFSVDTSIEDLEQLFESFQDVNYHEIGGNLWSAIVNLKEGKKAEAKKDMKKFYDLLDKELAEVEEEVPTVEVIEELPNLPLLKARLNLVKKMDKKNPAPLLKARLKIIKKMIDKAPKMAEGGGVSDLTDKEKLEYLNWTGENYQSVFPSHEYEYSQLHHTVEGAKNYMVNELGINKDYIKVLHPNYAKGGKVGTAEERWEKKAKKIREEVGYKKGDKTVKLAPLHKYPINSQIMAVTEERFPTWTLISKKKAVHEDSGITFILPNSEKQK
jgi:hypothetical protein